MASISSALEMVRHASPPDADPPSPGVIVGFSGGKDSMVCLDLAVRALGVDRVVAFHLYIVPDLDVENRIIEAARSRYPGLQIHQLPHPNLGDYLQLSMRRRRRPSVEQNIHRRYRWGDVERVVRSRSGHDWFVYGHRAADSIHRRGMLVTARGMLHGPRRCYPIWDWKPADVFAYLKSRKLRTLPMFGTASSNTSGINPESTSFIEHLRDHYPSDYEKFVRMFPEAPLSIARDDQRGEYGVTA